MLAKDLIVKNIIPVKIGDKIDSILAEMSMFMVRQLPVIQENVLIGLVSEESIQDRKGKLLEEENMLGLAGKYVEEGDHVFEVLKHVADHNLTLIPVVSQENLIYLGSITQESLMQYIAGTDSIIEPGSIVVLEMRRQDYSLADISRCIENENAQILSTLITNNQQDEMMEVVLKINTQKISAIISALERHGYLIKASFNETNYDDNLKEHYDGLMSYLSV